ncbi:MAG: hypothetical protein GY807_03480 [Gammaproteobacteria bacterium]|nr:hypothetical protein [Gammaproteobacteria bacterium]
MTTNYTYYEHTRPILDGAQHDYVLEHNRDGDSDGNRGSAAPFSGFGVAILDGAEHDYVFDGYSDERQVSYIAQGSSEFGVAILDDSIHDYVRDHDPDTHNSDITITTTTWNYGDNRGARKQ